jgi:radical SAM superfamily enzyme YgiQ (UPF0313 family)
MGVFGEGEQTFVDVLNMIRSGGSPESISGVLYRDATGNVRRTSNRPLIEKLDSLPFPAWDLLEEFPGAYAPNLFFSPGQPAATLITSRGCPFACTFCDQSTFGHRYRAAPAQYVYDAVVQLQENYGIKYLIFCDDTFTLERNRMFEICKAFRDLKRPIAWSCDANVNTIDSEMLRAMKRAGCWAVSFGLESGSDLVLKSLCKAIDLGRAREAVTMTAEEGLHTKGLFILGTPEESTKTVRQTRHYLRSIPLSSMNLSKFTPYPGSELFALLSDKQDICYEQLNGMNFVLPSNHLSIEELEVEYYLTIKHFYQSFRSFRFHVPMLLGHWENIRRLLGVVPAFVRAKIGARNGVNKGET